MNRLALTLFVVFVTTTLFAQKKNLFWAMRVDVKMDKRLEWEKKAPLFMKTHYPQFNFRVYQVMTGENSGNYVIAAGPFSYKDFDVPPVFPKGESLAKTEEQVLDALCVSAQVNHYRRVDNISNANANRKIKFVGIRYVELEIGKWEEMRELLLRRKEARAKLGWKYDIDYFRPSESGSLNTYAAVVFLEKMEDMDLEEDITETYNKLYGANAWFKDNQKFYSIVKSIKSELRVLRTDLSSPGAATVAFAN